MPIPLGVITFHAALVGWLDLLIFGIRRSEWMCRRPPGSPARSTPPAVRGALA